uniref:Maturation protein n=1 Tax=Fushun levivirus 2 TaxID=2905458 RepID=A0A8K1XFE4_9VIRU|nr:MAG: maturation protein [Fushun levivirus 2]
MPRTRDRIIGSSGGTALCFYEGSIIAEDFSDEGTASRDRCVDEFGSRNGVFTAEHLFSSGGSYSLNYIGPDFSYKLNKWTPSAFRGLGPYDGHLSDDNRPSNPYFAVQVLAGTNPSRPMIDLPVSIFELRELPDLVRSLGNNLIKRWAKGTLMREFGWTPLASDYNNLLKFAQSTSNRMELLKKLSKAPMTRKVHLYDSIVTGPKSNWTVNSTPPRLFTTVESQTTTTRKIWGYTTWTPDVEQFNKIAQYDPTFKFLSRKIVLGATVDASTLWNALPWSWLADWFGNIGDYLVANRNLVPCSPDMPAICETITTKCQTAILTCGFADKGSLPSTFTRLSKNRYRASAALPSAHLPLLTQRQVNILASLAVLRLR